MWDRFEGFLSWLRVTNYWLRFAVNSLQVAGFVLRILINAIVSKLFETSLNPEP
jgi:hypothetical protein